MEDDTTNYKKMTMIHLIALCKMATKNRRQRG
jgi:hypothetical protein